MPRALKVFQTQIGFYELVVAAPSQAAALRAWGCHLDLFADGTARPATDPRAVEAALAQPGVPLKRGVGSHDVFGLNPRLPRLPELGTAKPNKSGKRPATMSPPKHKPRAKPQPEPPDRRALDAAEAESRLIDVERRRDKALFADRLDAIAAEEKRLTSRRAAVEAEATAAERRYGALRSEADKVLKREEEAYAAAGRAEAADTPSDGLRPVCTDRGGW